jgi:hypothetical protein
MPLKRGFTLTAKDERAAADAVLPGAARRLEQTVQGRVLIATRAAAVAAAAAFAVAVCLAVTIAVCIAVTIAAVRAIAVEIVAAWAPASFASLAALAAPAAPAALALALPLPLLGALVGALCFPAAAPRDLHAMREAIRCNQMQSDAFAFPRRLRDTCCPASSSNEPLHSALEKPLECSTVGEIPPACNEGGN